MKSQAQIPALLIAGPTASGKSALALAMARQRNGVIINADSMQVYRELRILSARPTPEEEALAPHRLFGHVPGIADYSTGRWLLQASNAIGTCWAEGTLPIICGGTGLYFRALLQGLAEVPSIPEAVREKWRNFEGDLHAALASRDPETAARLHPSDRQRLCRALEVIEGTGRSLLEWQGDAQSNAVLHGSAVEQFFLDVPRAALYENAERRFDQMMEQGALEEVRALPALPFRQPLLKAIGVPELSAHLRGEVKLEDAVRDAKTATRQYIKRQLTWWRGQMQGWTSVKPDGSVL